MSKPWFGRATPRALSEDDSRRAAERIGCDVAAIKAVWEVEAGGRYFLDDGSVIRRFEPHHFPREFWAQIGFSVRKGEAPWRASLRLSNEDMFQDAAILDIDAAMAASSWGAPQIMGGMNHADAGFGSAREMVEHMAKSAAHQLGAFVQLVEAWGIAGAIRGHDWRAFALRYNGTGKPDHYARQIEAAFRRHSRGERSPVVLRVGDRGAAVVELQRALGVADDGAFGPVTLRAVERFQRDNGLVVDGVVGWNTWKALRAAKPPAQGTDDVEAPAAPPAPPAQPTATEERTDEFARWVGPGGVLAGLAGLLGQFRDALPEGAFEIAVYAGLALVTLAVAAKVIRWARG